MKNQHLFFTVPKPYLLKTKVTFLGLSKRRNAIKKTHLTMTLLYGATNLPKLELFKIVYELKQLLNQEFVLKLKSQIKVLNFA